MSKVVDWPSEYILLALLCEKPRHGYDLHRLVRTDPAFSAIWQIKRSHVYALLRKLERAGLIQHTTHQQVGGPMRQVLGPTQAGRQALETWWQTPERYPRHLRSSFLAKVYTALRLQPQAALELLNHQTVVLEAWINHHRAQASGDGFSAQVHRLRGLQAEAALTWLAGLRQRLLTACPPEATIPFREPEA